MQPSLQVFSAGYSIRTMPWHCLKQWFSVFRMLWPFNTVQVAVIPSHKIISLILHSCYELWSDTQGWDSQVENHWTKLTLIWTFTWSPLKSPFSSVSSESIHPSLFNQSCNSSSSGPSKWPLHRPFLFLLHTHPSRPPLCKDPQLLLYSACLLNLLLKNIIYVYMFHVCTCAQGVRVPGVGVTGYRLLTNWRMWELGTELGFPGRLESMLKHWAISLASIFSFLFMLLLFCGANWATSPTFFFCFLPKDSPPIN